MAFRLLTDVDANGQTWTVSFILVKYRRRNHSRVEALNCMTNEILRTPEDFSKISELVPFGLWPEYVRSSETLQVKGTLF